MPHPCPHPDPCALEFIHTLADCLCCCGRKLQGHPPLPKPGPWRTWSDEQTEKRALGRPPAPVVEPPTPRPPRIVPLTIHRPDDDGTGHCETCQRTLTFRRGKVEHAGNRFTVKASA